MQIIAAQYVSPHVIDLGPSFKIVVNEPLSDAENVTVIVVVVIGRADN